MGQVLFDVVCEYLDVLEKDYFGLALWDSSNCKVNDFTLDSMTCMLECITFNYINRSNYGSMIIKVKPYLLLK